MMKKLSAVFAATVLCYVAFATIPVPVMGGTPSPQSSTPPAVPSGLIRITDTKLLDELNRKLNETFNRNKPGSTRRLLASKTNGPFGGGGGSPFDDGVGDGITSILTTYGDAIDSVQIAYRNSQTWWFWSDRHGGFGGSGTSQFGGFAPGQDIYSIDVWTDTFAGSIKVVGIEYTALVNGQWSSSGTLGRRSGTKANSWGRVRGFFGRSGTLLDQIGFHVDA